MKEIRFTKSSYLWWTAVICLFSLKSTKGYDLYLELKTSNDTNITTDCLSKMLYIRCTTSRQNTSKSEAEAEMELRDTANLFSDLTLKICSDQFNCKDVIYDLQWNEEWMPLSTQKVEVGSSTILCCGEQQNATSNPVNIIVKNGLYHWECEDDKSTAPGPQAVAIGSAVSLVLAMIAVLVGTAVAVCFGLKRIRRRSMKTVDLQQAVGHNHSEVPTDDLPSSHSIQRWGHKVLSAVCRPVQVTELHLGEDAPQPRLAFSRYSTDVT